jgi:hypothetical protein
MFFAILEKEIINHGYSYNKDQKLGEEGKILSKEEQEDFLLGEIMEAENTEKDVSKKTILKGLTTICYE